MNNIAAGRAPESAPELTVVIPVFNEKDNVPEVIARVENALNGIRWELLFVDDDSPDGTADAVLEYARKDFRVRLVRRIGRRGLSSACIEGMLASSAPVLAVMDGDLQHDEQILGDMYQSISGQNNDLAIASRYMDGGSLGQWSDSRISMSRLAGKLARLVTGIEVSDPMSGFFMLRAELLHGCVRKLSLTGYKILLDILASLTVQPRIAEIPYTFRNRVQGQSKLDSAVLWEYLLMLLQKMFGSKIPIRFISFSIVGGFGVFVHMAVVYLVLAVTGIANFVYAQAAATLVAMTSNFLLNNVLTYRDKRLHGKALVTGWISFVIACSIGAVANVGVASYLFEMNGSRWVLPAIAGVAVGAVWNYAVTSIYTWKK